VSNAGIPTFFDGIQYRSRLEAKWAAFFTQIGWEFVYEPFDGNGYIPDFLIQGDMPMIVEIKPAVTGPDFHDAMFKTLKGLEGVWDRDVLVLGATPFPDLKSAFGPSDSAGLMDDGDWGCEGGPAIGTGLWMKCGQCGANGVHHDEQSFACRPCGHHEGDHLLGEPDRKLVNYWNHATNEVRWEGR
jgi:hypothetical protein